MPALFIHAIIPTSEIIGFQELDTEAGGPVYTVPFRGLAAVVQPTPPLNVRRLLPPTARIYLQRHRRIVDHVRTRYSVLPVQFGTILADEIQVQRLLHLGHDQLQCRLASLEAVTQMDVTAVWPLEAILFELSQDSSTTALRTEREANPSATKADRARLGRHVNEALEQRRQSVADVIHAALNDLAPATAVQACIDERIVTNMALLLDERSLPALDGVLADLEARIDTPLTFRRAGPMPPYAFSTVTVQIAPAEMVDAARVWLGLTPYATKTTIEHTYRRRTASLHPDRTTDPDAEAQRTALRACYRLLLAADAQSAQPGEPVLLIDVPRLDLPEPSPTISFPS